jgi:2-keto-4-pentenoate hydratase/2-oxohepta-3-ene-1,7-dioic acid hydratase in catechol pathway
VTEQRFIRFVTEDDSTPRWGVRRGDLVEVLSAAPWRESSSPTGRTVSASAVILRAPAQPTKVLALGYNYKDLFGDPAALTSAREPHFTDPGFEPIVFLKGPNAVADPDAEIEIPVGHEVWIEVEIAVVIGRRVRNLRDGAAARDAVFGVTIGNDLTALNVLGRDWHLARSKGLDGFCPLGPELVSGFDDSARRMSSSISGRVTQASTTANRVLDTYETVAFVSRLMTLEPGDVVLTGTPAGARQSIVRAGDRVVLEIEGLGTLTNTIR